MSFQSKEWILADASGSDGLKARIVSTPPLGCFDVLVKMKALSLNHRDVVLASVWLFFSTFHPKKDFFFS
jgi:NADPH:quinone reductase-like Zn-dependent oxidoreductase